MRAQVPYLAGLARQAAGPATLRPPRQLFVGDTHATVRSPGRDGSPRRRAADAAALSFPRPFAPSDAGEEPPASPGIAPDVPGTAQVAPHPSLVPRAESPPVAGASATAADAGLVAHPVGPLPSSRARPAGHAARGQPPGSWTGPAWGRPVELPPAIEPVPVTGETDRRPAAASRPGPAGPDVPGTAQVAPHPSLVPRTESRQVAGAAAATAVDAGLVAHPVGPLPSSRARPAGHAARGQPPGSWTGPAWGTPVELPPAIEPVPVTGETDRRPAAASRPGPEALPSGPGPVGAAGLHQGQLRGEPGISVTFGARDAAGGPRRSRGPAAAVRDLVPPTTLAPRSIEMPGPVPGGSRQEPRVTGPARVSIGTIEVTVVPPPRPAPAHETRPPAQVARGWSRPPSLLAVSAGTGRLRDGLRRWYGTAQG